MIELKKIKAVCITRYIDEVSLDEFEQGNIEFEDLIVYKVGDEKEVTEGFDPYYWEPISDIPTKNTNTTLKII